MKALSRICVFVASVVALSACGVGNHAHAATYPNEFADQYTGKVYSLHTAQVIVVADGMIKVTDTITYTQHQHPDNGYAQFARLKTAPAFADFFEIVPGTWINLKFAQPASCVNGVVTVNYRNGSTDYADAGCSRFNTLRANVN